MKIGYAVMMTILISFGVVLARAVEITVSYENKEQPPYYMGDTDEVLKEKPGLAVEMVQMLSARIPGLKINLKRTPWKRCTYDLKNNSVDGIFNASYQEERLEIGWYPTTDRTHKGPVDSSRRITTIAYSFYTLKGTELEWDGTNYESIKAEGIVGAPLGYSIVGDLQKEGLTVDESISTETNLNKLLANRFSVIALQEVTCDAKIKANPEKYKDIIKVAPPIKTKPYYLMLSRKFVKNHPELAQQIWDTLKTIRKTELDTLAAKYQ